MNKYTKPTFIIASLGVNALAASSCSYKITDEDKDFFDLWAPGWDEKGFHPAEGCSIPIEQYCKFSAGNDTSLSVTQAFTS